MSDAKHLVYRRRHSKGAFLTALGDGRRGGPIPNVSISGLGRVL